MVFHMLRWDGEETQQKTLRSAAYAICQQTNPPARRGKGAEQEVTKAAPAPFFFFLRRGWMAPGRRSESRHQVHRYYGWATTRESAPWRDWPGSRLFNMPVDLRVEDRRQNGMKRGGRGRQQLTIRVDTFGRPRTSPSIGQMGIRTPPECKWDSYLTAVSSCAKDDTPGALAEYQRPSKALRKLACQLPHGLKSL